MMRDEWEVRGAIRFSLQEAPLAITFSPRKAPLYSVYRPVLSHRRQYFLLPFVQEVLVYSMFYDNERCRKVSEVCLVLC